MIIELDPKDSYQKKLEILKRIERYIEDSIRESCHLIITIKTKDILIEK